MCAGTSSTSSAACPAIRTTCCHRNGAATRVGLAARTPPRSRVPIVASRMNPAAHRIIFSVVPVDKLDHLETLWLDLEARADGSFFLSWQWIGCWLRECGLRPTAVVGCLDGRVVSLALFVMRRVWRHH